MTRVLAATLCLATLLAALATETGRVIGSAEGRALAAVGALVASAIQ